MALSSTISQQLARFVELQPATHTRLRGAEASVAAATTVGVLYLAFGAQSALVGVSGAFVAFTGWDRPLLSRAKILVQLGLVYLVCVTAGVLVAGHGLLTVLVLGVVGLVVTFWYHALIGDAPGPMLLIAGAGFAAFSGGLDLSRAGYVLLVLAGMTVSSLVCLLFQLPFRQIPLRDALATVTGAVDALGEAPSDSDPKTMARLRDAAFAAHFQAQEILVDSTPREHPTMNRRRLDRTLHALHVRMMEAVCRRELPWATIQVHEVLKLPYLGTPNTRYLLRWAMSGASMPWLAARRMGLAILLTGGAALLVGSTKPQWAIMTTAIVLSGGVDRVTTTHRAAHRVFGTVVGLFLYLWIDSQSPSPPVVLALVLACVFLTQILGPRNFALASAAITPMALLMFAAGSQAPAAFPLVEMRLLETALGAGTAVLVLWVTGFSTPVALVRRQFRRALRALERTLDLYSAGWARTPLGFSARRNLHFEQLACVRILDLALADSPRKLAHWPQLEADIGTLTHVVLAAGWTGDPARTLDTAAMADRLRIYLAGLPPVSSRPIDPDRAHRELSGVLAVGRERRGAVPE